MKIFKMLLVFMFLFTGSLTAGSITVKELAHNYRNPKSVIRWVQKNIKYKSDKLAHNRAEYWQPSKETLELMSGDCEDSAVLISDILKELGIESVILCVYKRRGFSLRGHAVCVYKYNNQQWIGDNGRNFRLKRRYNIAGICKIITKDWVTYGIYNTKHIRRGKNKTIRSGWKFENKEKYIF